MLNQLGFSAPERRAIYFLLIILLIGSSVRAYRSYRFSRQLDLWIEQPKTDSALDISADLFYPSSENPLNINTATSSELELLPGIGPLKAQSIIKYRDMYGLFSNVDELDEVYGIGPKTVEKLRRLICVNDSDNLPKNSPD